MKKRPTIPTRAAGILLPVSSLPSPYGIGTLGKAAYEWIDFLSLSGQQYWQVLPLSPTSYGDSPYQSFSAFAGNPYFIDLDLLHKEGLLSRRDYADFIWGESLNKVDYGTIYQHREGVLRKAFARFTQDESLQSFRSQNNFWLEDYALYMAIKATQGNRSWAEWAAPLRHRQPKALEDARKNLAEEIRFHCFVQHTFFSQWNALREYARQHNVQIIGDLPIYVAMDSADVWAHRQLFQLDAKGLPTAVAGCPPDCFALTGQLWGNPLYDWNVMKQDGFTWWLERCKASFVLYDVLRIDHFRGLESYYSIPYAEKTAKNGEWVKGPGMVFLDTLRKNLPEVRIIAEDLGFLTNDVRKLLKQSGYPGMKLLLYAFDEEDSEYLPYNYTPNCIVYTGTHDNDTLLGWIQAAPKEAIRRAMSFTNTRVKASLPREIIRLAYLSCASLAVIPLQDWLGLGSEARFNIPSTLGGNNWRWRVTSDALTNTLADDIFCMTKLYGRLASKNITNDSVSK